MSFKLVSDGEQLVRVALPYLAAIYIVTMMLLRMGYSSTKGGGKFSATWVNKIWVALSFFVSIPYCLSSG